jgi:hypothetical protein
VSLRAYGCVNAIENHHPNHPRRFFPWPQYRNAKKLRLLEVRPDLDNLFRNIVSIPLRDVFFSVSEIFCDCKSASDVLRNSSETVLLDVPVYHTNGKTSA